MKNSPTISQSKLDYTEEQVRKLVPNCNSYAELIRKLGAKPNGGRLATLKKYVEEWEVDISHFGTRKQSYNEKQLKDAAKKCINMTELMRVLQLYPSSGRRATLKKNIEKWHVDISHFETKDQRNKRLMKNLEQKNKIPLEQILVQNSTYSTFNLKERLVKEGIKKMECEFCGQGVEWRGKRMYLVLDHINGIKNDHRLDNLRILCPNCNGTLETHCNRKNKKCVNCGSWCETKVKHCSVCIEKNVWSIHQRGLPNPKGRKVEWPSKEVLEKLAWEKPTSQIAKEYGVTDNAVAKWCKHYGIKKPPRGYWSNKARKEREDAIK